MRDSSKISAASPYILICSRFYWGFMCSLCSATALRKQFILSLSVISVVMNFFTSSMPVFRVWLSENFERMESRAFRYSKSDSEAYEEGVTVSLDIIIKYQ